MEFHLSGDIARQNHPRQTTEEGSDQDNTVLVRLNDIDVMKKNSEAEAGSSSLVNSRLVTQITPPNQLGNVVNRKRKYRTSPGQTEFVTLTLTYDGINRSRQALPWLFMKNNHMTEPGMIAIMGKDGSKTMVRLLRDSIGRMSFGQHWREFVLANDLKIGESFTLEAFWEDTTPMLKLSTMELKKDKTKIEEGGTSSSVINHRVLTLKLAHEDLRTSTLILPAPFMRDNGIEKLGKISFFGQNNTKWWGYLLTRTGIVAVGIGWKYFCESNGVNEGDSFSLEYIPQDQNSIPILKFGPNV